MRQILIELENNRPTRYLEIACAFIDLSFTARESFVELFTKQRERTLQDQLLHDFTFQFERGDAYITCMFAPRRQAYELGKRLANYCALKKYQMKSDFWIGLACIADEPTLLQGSIVLQNPWKYDAKMERQVASSFPVANR